MAREAWFVDGWEITDGRVRDVELRSGLYRTPGAEGSNVKVTNRTGEVWRRKRHGPGSFVLNLWLGDDAPREVVEGLYDEILRAVAHVDRMPTWERRLASGETRLCRGEVVASIAPEPLGQRAMRIGLEVQVPGGYWLAGAAVTASTPAGSSASRDLDLTPFAVSTAPMEHLTYRVDGPATNVRVEDRSNVDLGATGEWFTYTGAIPNGATLIVNASTWQVTGLGFTPSAALLLHSGGRFLTVPAARPGRVQVLRMTLSGGGAATRLTVTGQPAFLA